MLIKHNNLNFVAPIKLTARLYIVIGEDYVQKNQVIATLKSSWQKQLFEYDADVDIERHRIYLETVKDWQYLHELTQTHSLFSQYKFIEMIYEKKNLEAEANNFIQSYLNCTHTDDLLILHSSTLSQAAVKAHLNHSGITVIQCLKPNITTVTKWLYTELKHITPFFDDKIPELIQQYTANNLLAAQQILDKLSLIIDKDEVLDVSIVHQHLLNQCHYHIFELEEACLLKDSKRVLDILRQTEVNKSEETLVLWHFSQLIRCLLILIEVRQNSKNFKQQAQDLKIWSHRIPLYHNVIAEFDYSFLKKLLEACMRLDKCIKTNQIFLLWPRLECIGLSLCLRKQVGWLE